MKLLMVSACLPQPSWGASGRNYHLLKALARQHEVALVALVHEDEPATGEEIALLTGITPTVQLLPHPLFTAKRRRQLLNLARGRSYTLTQFILPEVQHALDAQFNAAHYDGVVFESALTAGYRLPEHISVIIDQHNIEYELLERTAEIEQSALRKWYNRLEAGLLKPGERARCRNADLVLVTSEREQLLLKDILPEKKIEVVPNGVDVEAFSNDGTEPEAGSQIIFTGSMNYYPNIQAVHFFAQYCWPLIRAQVPDATWLIVGRKPEPEVQKLAELPGVTVTGQVADVRPYLATSAVAIAPLQIGSGTRLKILEALAMQKAVVSTSVGCEGLAVTAGKHLAVADQPEAFAGAVVAFLRNPQLRATYGTAGRALVEAEYSWQECGTRLLQAMETINKAGAYIC